MTSSNCPSCGSAEITSEQPYHGPGKIFFPEQIVECKDCGLGRASPMPNDQQLSEYYSGGYWEASEIVTTARNFPSPNVLSRSRWKHIEKYADNWAHKKGLSVLDVGAGHGFLGLHAAQSKKVAVNSYHMVEPDENLRTGLQAVWATDSCELTGYETLEQTSGTFDVIALCHVLEHVNDPSGFLKALVSKLTPGGMLFIEVPNRDDSFKNDVFPHLLFFNKVSLIEIVKNAGLLDVTGEVRGPAPERSVLSDQPRVLRKLLSRVLFRFEKFLPVRLLTAYYQWLLAPEQSGEAGIWLRATGFVTSRNSYPGLETE